MIWVVEVLGDGKWEPTTGASLTRKAARNNICWWKNSNRDRKFRIVKYVRESEWLPVGKS